MLCPRKITEIKYLASAGRELRIQVYLQTDFIQASFEYEPSRGLANQEIIIAQGIM
jgi:hypothetical protein